ncbi:MAG TPA: hypothetical protein VIM69_05960 [Opitutaceae bacterium]
MPAPTFSSTNDATAPRDTVDSLVTQLTNLLGQIVDVSRTTADPTALLQLHTEYLAVQSVLTQATQAQLAKDDAIFSQATTTLKSQAKVLDGMEDQIKSLVKDVDVAAKIVNGVVQAAALIAKL